jgi:hypothetical protein
MFAIVALSAKVRLATPAPKNYTNFPTTPFFLKVFVTCKTKSVAVTCYLSLPVNLKPMTYGKTIEIA